MYPGCALKSKSQSEGFGRSLSRSSWVAAVLRDATSAGSAVTSTAVPEMANCVRTMATRAFENILNGLPLL